MKVSLVLKYTFMKTTNPNTGTPGLASLAANNNAPKVASKTTVKPTTPTPTSKDPTPKTTTPVVEKTTVATHTTPAATTKTPAATTAVKKNVTEAKSTPTRNTSSFFKVGEQKYNIIEDSDKVRSLIEWDDQGNVSPTSPVQIIGKNVSGGFILAASDSVPNVSKQQFPYSADKGIHFSSLESDKSGDISRMQKIHSKTFDDFTSITDQKAANDLRSMYIRTGRLK